MSASAPRRFAPAIGSENQDGIAEFPDLSQRPVFDSDSEDRLTWEEPDLVDIDCRDQFNL